MDWGGGQQKVQEQLNDLTVTYLGASGGKGMTHGLLHLPNHPTLSLSLPKSWQRQEERQRQEGERWEWVERRDVDF
jgi:hypothetical protein